MIRSRSLAGAAAQQGADRPRGLVRERLVQVEFSGEAVRAVRRGAGNSRLARPCAVALKTVQVAQRQSNRFVVGALWVRLPSCTQQESDNPRGRW